MHGLLSSADRTSLRKTEEHYRSKGYDVQYIEYNSLLDNPTNQIIHSIEGSGSQYQETVVIGHSLGGKYVSTSAKAYRGSNKNVYYYTVNSPWSSSGDGTTVDLKHKSDWSNVLAFFNDPWSLVSSRWSEGGHAAGEEQVVR